MALLWQILSAVPKLRHIIDSIAQLMTSEDTEKLVRPYGTLILQDLLPKAMLGLNSIPVYCFIDALDECKEDQVREMINCLTDLGAHALPVGASLRMAFESPIPTNNTSAWNKP